MRQSSRRLQPLRDACPDLVRLWPREAPDVPFVQSGLVWTTGRQSWLRPGYRVPYGGCKAREPGPGLGLGVHCSAWPQRGAGRRGLRVQLPSPRHRCPQGSSASQGAGGCGGAGGQPTISVTAVQWASEPAPLHWGRAACRPARLTVEGKGGAQLHRVLTGPRPEVPRRDPQSVERHLRPCLPLALHFLGWFGLALRGELARPPGEDLGCPPCGHVKDVGAAERRLRPAAEQTQEGHPRGGHSGHKGRCGRAKPRTRWEAGARGGGR